MKNKTFLISSAVLIISFIYGLLSLLGVAPRVSEKQVTDLIYMAVNTLAMLGVVIDPTTEGLSDSDRAMTYYTDNDERFVSEVTSGE